MKFAQMLSFWHLKGMITKTNIVSDHTEPDTRVEHYIVSIRVQSDSNTHANILYRQENDGDKAKVAMIHANIFHSGTVFTTIPDSPDKLFIKNASVAKMRYWFVEN